MQSEWLLVPHITFSNGEVSSPITCGGFAVLSSVRMQACQGLLLCLPSYAYLVAPAVNGAPVWEADSVLASRMQFLMSMLGPCIPRLTQVRPPC